MQSLRKRAFKQSLIKVFSKSLNMKDLITSNIIWRKNSISALIEFLRSVKIVYANYLICIPDFGPIFSYNIDNIIVH